MASNALRGSAAVVTGSSSGIGRATAIALATCGVQRQIVHCRTNTESAAELAGQIGPETSVVAADLSQPGDREMLVETSFQRLGTIQTWVFNAGADVLTGANRELSFEEKLRMLIEVDVVGTIELARAVAERLRDQAAGEFPPSMTFIGWDQAARGMEGDAGQMFAPVKAAVMGFAMSLAQELAPAIRANVVAPGWIQTAWGVGTEGYWDHRARQQSLMDRWGKPEDVAAAIMYAADPVHTFVTGQMIEVNGGWNRRFSTT